MKAHYLTIGLLPACLILPAFTGAYAEDQPLKVSSAEAVRNTFSCASGNTTDAISRPSATSPGERRKACWRRISP